jgi:hypothetical protein
VWDAVSGAELATLTGHNGSVGSVGWSPDGTRLATASQDETVRVWDAVSFLDGDVADQALVESPSPVSVNQVFDFERVLRLQQDEADRLRARLEPFMGHVRFLLDENVFSDEQAPQVEYELDQLRSELYGEKPGEPLGAVVHSYFTSLLAETLPHMDLGELQEAGDKAGLEGQQVAELVEAGTQTGATPEDVSPAVEIIDRVPVLAPADWSEFEKTRWSANLVGWTMKTSAAGLGGAGAAAGLETALNLSWASPGWAAIIGGVIGIAAAIARPTGLKQQSKAGRQ